MKTSFPIGRVLGIPIRVHLSWFIVLVVVTGSMSGQFFTGSVLPALMMGFLGAMLLFGSVLLHELGHCVFARFFGIHVRQIQLFIFGGVAEILGEPRKVSHEVIIAAAGPAVSFLLAGAFLVASLQLGWSVQYPQEGGALGRLAGTIFLMNFVLGAFNLIPAFPSDGGRIFRALLWKALGDYRLATAWAAGVGMGFAGVLAAYGIYEGFVRTHATVGDLAGARFSGVWMVLIGLFLARSASQAKRSASISAALREGTLGDVMIRLRIAVPADRTLLQVLTQPGGPSAAELLLGFPVTEAGACAGFVEPAQLYAVPRDRWGQVTVGQLMTPIVNLPSLQVEEPLDSLVRVMAERGVPGALVFHGRDLVGYATRTDVARWLIAAEEPALILRR